MRMCEKSRLSWPGGSPGPQRPRPPSWARNSVPAARPPTRASCGELWRRGPAPPPNSRLAEAPRLQKPGSAGRRQLEESQVLPSALRGATHSQSQRLTWHRKTRGQQQRRRGSKNPPAEAGTAPRAGASERAAEMRCGPPLLSFSRGTRRASRGTPGERCRQVAPGQAPLRCHDRLCRQPAQGPS